MDRLPTLVVRHCTHRSKGGPSREISAAGVRACRRCTAVLSGFAAALLGGVWLHVAFGWIALLLAPLFVDMIREKGFGRPHRPRLLFASSAIAGVALAFEFHLAVRQLGVIPTMAGIAIVRLVGVGIRQRTSQPRPHLVVAHEVST